jgi:hypothetical protein
MAIKIVQNVNRISPSAGVAVTSNPIPLKSGYLRVSTGTTGVYVEIGSDPLVTINSFHIPPYSAEVIKERISKQRIAGITTGATTLITFPENAGHSFSIGDYVTIENAQPTGINTTHRQIISLTDSSINIAANTSSIVGVVTLTDSVVSRSVKISALSESNSTDLSITEVTQLVSE